MDNNTASVIIFVIAAIIAIVMIVINRSGRKPIGEYVPDTNKESEENNVFKIETTKKFKPPLKAPSKAGRPKGSFDKVKRKRRQSK